MKPTFKAGKGSFDRDRLRKVALFPSDSDVFAVVTRILDKDTLQTRTIESYFTERTLQRVVGLYLAHFAKDDFIRI